MSGMGTVRGGREMGEKCWESGAGRAGRGRGATGAYRLRLSALLRRHLRQARSRPDTDSMTAKSPVCEVRVPPV